ncbi:MAG TPA: DUF3108 domain-containing protein [Candidatus Aminicenantes bacterium]|nr:DUF3108 domain-containing protein [Candidatus Aminicenantes bacterium]
MTSASFPISRRRAGAGGCLLGLLLLALPGLAASWALPFRPGERITLNVSWSDTVVAATLTLDVTGREVAGGVSCLSLRGEVKPSAVIGKLYPVYYKAESLLEEVTLLPQRASMYNREKSRIRRKNTYFDRRAGRVYYTYQTRSLQKKDFPADRQVIDLLSWLYVLRASPLREGWTAPVQVTDNGRLFTLRCQVTRGAPVKTTLGELPVWRLVPRVENAGGQKVPRRMVLWMSGDERRLPLRFEVDLPVGKFVAMLSDYTR